MKESKLVKDWSHKDSVFRMSKRNWPGNNINRANIGAIETYQEIEGDDGLDQKYAGLCVRYRGKVL